MAKGRVPLQGCFDVLIDSEREEMGTIIGF
jgi:hypothetical protein